MRGHGKLKKSRNVFLQSTANRSFRSSHKRLYNEVKFFACPFTTLIHNLLPVRPPTNSLQCRRILGGRKLVNRIATMKPPSLILWQRKIGESSNINPDGRCEGKPSPWLAPFPPLFGSFNMALSRLKPFARARWKRLHCRLVWISWHFYLFTTICITINQDGVTHRRINKNINNAVAVTTPGAGYACCIATRK